MGFKHEKQRSYDRTVTRKRTGEVLDEQRVTEKETSKYAIDYRGAPYGTVSDAALELMDILDFGKNEYRFIHHLIRHRSRTDHGRVNTGSAADLASEMGMSRPSFYRARGKVLASGLAYEENGGWQLNPRWLFNAGGEAHFYALRRVPRHVPDLFPATSYCKDRLPAGKTISEDTWRALRIEREAKRNAA
ncbi:hypothetical protein [Streptomyces sp. AP-93]|uniref:hypothetical protein n=1 Tax=Streptomyces sp. AP-93 TaxID=2929048 RepID=UPI001FB0092D|nr:hypothetical protein [Streptomyces sp. AP-93]MCJ0868108.1 hypothetical protein [Streptomyces sp. AP-93]